MSSGSSRMLLKVPRLLALGACMVLSGCSHGPCSALGSLFGCSWTSGQTQSGPEDLSIRMPELDEPKPGDLELDGYTLQAIRIAADDFLNPDSTDLPCKARQVSHQYQARREGDIIFVRIGFNPESCGRKVGMLDSGATYAVSVDGRILRRFIDGMVPEQPKPAPPAPLDPTPKEQAPAPEGASDPATPPSAQGSPSIDTRSSGL
jgi:hypothetical protein